MHRTIDFVAIFIADVIGDVQRSRMNHQAKGTLFHGLSIQADLALEIGNRDGRAVAEGRKHAGGKGPNGELALLGID